MVNLVDWLHKRGKLLNKKCLADIRFYGGLKNSFPDGHNALAVFFFDLGRHRKH